MAGSLYKGEDLFSGYDVASNVGTNIDISTIVSSFKPGEGTRCCGLAWPKACAIQGTC